MKYYVLIGFLAWSGLLPLHDIAMARFDLTQVEDRFFIAIELDKEDTYKTLSLELGSPIASLKEPLAVYLSRHLDVELNKEQVRFTIDEIKENRLFFNVKISSPSTGIQQVGSVKVKNTCLIETVANQSNIFLFDLNGKTRMFRLHEGRKTIDFQY